MIPAIAFPALTLVWLLTAVAMYRFGFATAKRRAQIMSITAGEPSAIEGGTDLPVRVRRVRSEYDVAELEGVKGLCDLESDTALRFQTLVGRFAAVDPITGDEPVVEALERSWDALKLETGITEPEPDPEPKNTPTKEEAAMTVSRPRIRAFLDYYVVIRVKETLSTQTGDVIVVDVTPFRHSGWTNRPAPKPAHAMTVAEALFVADVQRMSEGGKYTCVAGLVVQTSAGNPRLKPIKGDIFLDAAKVAHDLEWANETTLGHTTK